MNQMSDDEALHGLYYMYALAMTQAQLLEDGISHIIVACHMIRRAQSGAMVEVEHVEAIWNENLDVTFGGLLTKLRQVAEIAPGLDAELKECRILRNRLAHHFFMQPRETDDALLTVDGKILMAQQAADIRTTLKQVTSKVGDLLAKLSEMTGESSCEQDLVLFEGSGITPKLK